jgi:hypothetical protein
VRRYGSRAEWHAKSRRLHALEDLLAAVEADWAAGRVRVVRGGKRLESVIAELTPTAHGPRRRFDRECRHRLPRP